MVHGKLNFIDIHSYIKQVKSQRRIFSKMLVIQNNKREETISREEESIKGPILRAFHL